MSKTDQIHRFIFDNTDVRGELVSLEKSFQEAFSHQQCPLELKPIFGQFIAAVALLSETLKFDGIMTLQARGSGPVSLIMAEANSRGELRGFIRTSEHNEAPIMKDDKLLSLPDIIGEGVLAITVDPEKGERYQGIIPLDAQSLELCLSHYFEQSEQLPTSIQLFADDHHCGGLLLQCLPAQLIKDTEVRDQTWLTIKHLGSTISAKELYELEHSELLYRLFNEYDCRLFEEKNMTFSCSCNMERSANAVASMGREEAFSLLLERGGITTDCQFCGKRYSFHKKELIEIFGADEQTH